MDHCQIAIVLTKPMLQIKIVKILLPIKNHFKREPGGGWKGQNFVLTEKHYRMNGQHL